MHLALLALTFQLGLATHPVARPQGRASLPAADSVRDLRLARSAQSAFERSRRYNLPEGGGSSGPLEIDRPWDSFTDDHLSLMDHLGIDKFMVMGFCIGGPFIWNLLRRAPDRVIAAVLAQPSGFRKEMPNLFYENNMKGWGPALSARRPEITMAMVDAFLTRMYRTNADFVFTVTRDFVRTCQTPVLILPDDIPAHPYAVAMEAAMLAPKAEVSMFPWKEPKERIPLAVRQIRSFLRAHRTTTATA